MNRRELFPGLLLRAGESEHKHQIGGEIALDGAVCPNCNKHLTLFLSLDFADERLNIRNDLQLEFLRLFYCMRCALSWYPFVYRFKSPNEIEILKAHQGEIDDEEWLEEIGDSLPICRVRLDPLPVGFQAIIDRLNNCADIDDDEAAAINGALARRLNGPTDCFNQVGGRSFLFQRLKDPICVACGGQSYFLASLYNEPNQGIQVCQRGPMAQIIFFYCKSCTAITVVHSC